MANAPTLRTTQSGQSVCSFTVACQRPFKNDAGQYDADFINCVAWGKTAEFVQQHFVKGSSIGLQGRLQSRSYDAQDGSKRYVTEVIAANVEFVAPKKDGQQPAQQMPPLTGASPQQPAQQMTYQQVGSVYDDTDLPF